MHSPPTNHSFAPFCLLGIRKSQLDFSSICSFAEKGWTPVPSCSCSPFLGKHLHFCLLPSPLLRLPCPKHQLHSAPSHLEKNKSIYDLNHTFSFRFLCQSESHIKRVSPFFPLVYLKGRSRAGGSIVRRLKSLSSGIKWSLNPCPTLQKL